MPEDSPALISRTVIPTPPGIRWKGDGPHVMSVVAFYLTADDSPAMRPLVIDGDQLIDPAWLIPSKDEPDAVLFWPNH